MTDMVERAARALCRLKGIDPDGQLQLIGKTIKRWKLETGAVRVILKAAFKVTDEDAKAFSGKKYVETVWVMGWFPPKLSFAEAMQALSDAALGEGS